MRLRSLNLKLLVKQGKKSSPTVSAERNYTAKNNIAGLCTALLKEHGETTPLWTAYVSWEFLSYCNTKQTNIIIDLCVTSHCHLA